MYNPFDLETYYCLLSATLFIFGTLIGSFLNVLILRHNTGKTLLGRSGCMSCKNPLKWYELIPLVSFVIQKGRCRKCQSKVSIQYPLVELATGALFLLAFFISNSPVQLVFNCLLFSILVIITVHDLRHKIIPDRYVWMLVALAFLSLFITFTPFSFRSPSFLELVSGVLVASPLFFLWFFSRGRWIGLGDSKVVLATGTLLGIQMGLVALMYAFWIGALYGLTIMFIGRLRTVRVLNKGEQTLTMKSEVPFAPFLILGFLIIYAFPEIFFHPFLGLYF